MAKRKSGLNNCLSCTNVSSTGKCTGCAHSENGSYADQTCGGPASNRNCHFNSPETERFLAKKGLTRADSAVMA